MVSLVLKTASLQIDFSPIGANRAQNLNRFDTRSLNPFPYIPSKFSAWSQKP